MISNEKHRIFDPPNNHKGIIALMAPHDPLESLDWQGTDEAQFPGPAFLNGIKTDVQLPNRLLQMFPGPAFLNGIKTLCSLQLGHTSLVSRPGFLERD